jgi:hypothetical protein
LPDLATLIGDVRLAKDDCEGMVVSLKNRWRAKIILDGDAREGADRYRDVASHFNGISESLEAMLSTGHDEHSEEAMRARLSEAQRRYQSFRSWYETLPRTQLRPTSPEAASPPGVGAGPEAPDLAPLIADLTKHFFDSLNQASKENRERLIGLLHDVRFKPWQEIDEPIRNGSHKPGQADTPPVGHFEP